MESPVQFVAAALFRQQADDVHDAAATSRYRVDVAAVQDIGSGKNFFQSADCRTAGAMLPVVRQSPSGIEGHAETMDLFAQQQGFEPHLRGDAVNFIHLAQQAERAHIFCQQVHTGGQIMRIEEPLFAAAEHIGMGLDPDIRTGMFTAGCFQHAGERTGICPTKEDAQIMARLVQDQDAWTAPIRDQACGGIRSMVILAQIVR